MNAPDVSSLRASCVEMGLENASVLDKYSDDELRGLYNGIGPESFPEWLVDVLDSLNPSMGPACLIHDVEWAESCGTRSGFTSSNARLMSNGFRTARFMYGWWRPRRYIVMADALVLAASCQEFGYRIWLENCNGRSRTGRFTAVGAPMASACFMSRGDRRCCISQHSP